MYSLHKSCTLCCAVGGFLLWLESRLEEELPTQVPIASTETQKPHQVEPRTWRPRCLSDVSERGGWTANDIVCVDIPACFVASAGSSTSCTTGMHSATPLTCIRR